MKKILELLAQNSTWRGIIAIVTAAGVQIAPELQSAIITAGLGAIGLINVIRDGRKSK